MVDENGKSEKVVSGKIAPNSTNRDDQIVHLHQLIEVAFEQRNYLPNATPALRRLLADDLEKLARLLRERDETNG